MMRRGAIVRVLTRVCGALLALSACDKDERPATAVLVELRSDFGAELASIDVEIRDADDHERGGTHHFDLGNGLALPLSFGVEPNADRSEGFVAVATGRDRDGAFLVETKAKADFASGKTLGPLLLWLHQACREVMCDRGMTCAAPDGGPETAACAPISAPVLGEVPPDTNRDAGTGSGDGSGGAHDGEGRSGTDAGAARDGAVESGNGDDAGTSDAAVGGDETPIVDNGVIAAAGDACPTESERACPGHAADATLVCEDGTWRASDACDGDERCDATPGATQGTCQPIAELCTGKSPGTHVCDGSVRRRCDLDLVHLLPTDCGDHAHCDGASGGATCVCDEGYGVDHAECVEVDDCTPGACGPLGECEDKHLGYTCICGEDATGGGTTMCSDIDECLGTTICTSEYPCKDHTPYYVCSGQLADWPMPDSASGAQTQPSYAETADTVADNVTQLVWERVPPATYSGCTGNVGVMGDTCTQAQAAAYCASAAVANALGGSGWRLPTKIELESIVSFTHTAPLIQTDVFYDTVPDNFWTASEDASNSDNAFRVDFATGKTVLDAKTSLSRVRCVR